MYKMGSEFRVEHLVFINEISKNERSSSKVYGYV
jgi:hypothetical protein